MNKKLKKLYTFFLTDIRKINKYFLVVIILLILSSVGYTSFALFSYEVYSPSPIYVLFNDNKGPKCVIEGPETSEIGINSNATYVMNCTDSFGVVDKTITSSDFIITGDMTISNITKATIDNGYKYTITILSGTTDSIGNIRLKENVLQDGNGNYNDSVTSNNITIVLYKTFYITYNDVNYEYHYDNGMNWTTFVSSSYNDGSFTIDGTTIRYNGYKVAETGTAITTTATLNETTYTVLPKVYAWNKYTRSTENMGVVDGYPLHVIVYDSQEEGYELNYVRYYSTPAKSEIVEKGTTISGTYYTYTNFNPLKGYYYVYLNSSNPNDYKSFVRYIPSNATISRKIDGDTYLVYASYSYEVSEEYVTSEDSSAYPQNGWSGTYVYYEYLGEV